MGFAALYPSYDTVLMREALTLARNLNDGRPTGFTAADLDMLRHYRPHENVVRRPTLDGGKGYEITGHHELMVPLLAWSVLSLMDPRG